MQLLAVITSINHLSVELMGFTLYTSSVGQINPDLVNVDDAHVSPAFSDCTLAAVVQIFLNATCITFYPKKV